MVGLQVLVGKSSERLRENCVRVDVVEEESVSAGARRCKRPVGVAIGAVVLIGVMAVELAVSSGMAWTVWSDASNGINKPMRCIFMVSDNDGNGAQKMN